MRQTPGWPLTASPALLRDLRACARCHGIVDAAMTTCPTCAQWLGPAPLALWSGMVVAGGLVTVAAFFLPWLATTGAQPALSGFDLARIAQQLATAAGQPRPTAAASLALYLAPLAGLALLALPVLARVLRLDWVIVGRLVVGMAALPGHLALLAALFAVGLLGESQLTGWPEVGLIATGVGSLLGIAGGMALGGPGRARRGRG